MKILYGLFFTALILTACHNNAGLHRRTEQAKYRITIGIESEGQVLEEAQIDKTIQLLKSQLVNYGIIYKSVEVAPDQRQIAFNIIGRLTAQGEEDPGPDYYLNALAGRSQLEFWETFRNIDEPVKMLFGELVKKYNIGDKLVFTHSPIYPESVYPSAVIAEVAPGDMSLLDSLFRQPEVAGRMPLNMVLAWSFYTGDRPEGGAFFELYALKKTSARGPFLTGSDVLSIENSATEEPGMDPEFTIDVGFTPKASMILANKTRQLAQDSNREIAILIDGYVVTAPRVMSEISGGRCQISGNFELEQVIKITDRLKLGALPFELRVVEAVKL
jgi:hypothetical protein